MTASAPENLLTMELKKMADFGDFFGGVTRLHIAVQVQIMLFAIIFKVAFFKKQSKAVSMSGNDLFNNINWVICFGNKFISVLSTQ